MHIGNIWLKPAIYNIPCGLYMAGSWISTRQTSVLNILVSIILFEKRGLFTSYGIKTQIPVRVIIKMHVNYFTVISSVVFNFIFCCLTSLSLVFLFWKVVLLNTISAFPFLLALIVPFNLYAKG